MKDVIPRDLFGARRRSDCVLIVNEEGNEMMVMMIVIILSHIRNTCAVRLYILASFSAFVVFLLYGY